MFLGFSVSGWEGAASHKVVVGAPQHLERDASWFLVVEEEGVVFPPTHLGPPLSSSLSWPGCPWPVARWCVTHQAAVAAPHSSCQGQGALQKYFSATRSLPPQVGCLASPDVVLMVERGPAASS